MMHVDARWLRCRKRALNAEQSTRLNECFRDLEDDIEWFDNFTRPMYFTIVDRIGREYNSVWRRHADDMHLNREDILVSVIPKVLGQIRPEVTCDNEKDILELVQPLIEHAFEMPGPASNLKVGSKKWIQQKIDEDSYTFIEATQYRPIMEHWKATNIALGDERGYPFKTPEEIIPSSKIIAAKLL